MTNDINNIADMMTEAAKALIERDPHRLEQIENIIRNWLQTDSERMAQIHLLQAMTEAADLLLDTPSEIDVCDDEEEAA